MSTRKRELFDKLQRDKDLYNKFKSDPQAILLEYGIKINTATAQTIKEQFKILESQKLTTSEIIKKIEVNHELG